MPKPLFQENGSGMHCHQSLWKDGDPLFFGDGYGGLSDIGRWYVGGLLKHARSVLAFAAPTTNSYKRLVPGYEAPVNLVYSQRNRSAACRIPVYSPSPKAKRVEFRCPDPSCNPYLAFSAILMAGLDGVTNKIEPPSPVDEDLFDMPAEELARIVPTLPGRSKRRWRRSRPTTTTCASAASSPMTSSRPGCRTSAWRRPTPSACAPIPGSSPSTTTSDRVPLGSRTLVSTPSDDAPPGKDSIVARSGARHLPEVDSRLRACPFPEHARWLKRSLA